MTRKECLEQAMGCVLRDRNNSYGGPEDSFGVIANFWSVYLGRKVYPADVAMMMSLLKIARIKANKSYEDGYIDLAGYAACGAECAEGKPASKPKAEGGCCQNGNDQPEFKPGDRVQYRVTLPSVSDRIWVDAEYVRHLPDGRGHIVQDKKTGSVLIGDKDIRRIPKAEGCEALVEKDAPQTPAELYDKIIASNPATFGRPRTPTGEELAELAEEETHE